MEEKKTYSDMEFYADTMEQEKKNREMGSINTEKGIMVNELGKGLNRDQGVFDRTAIFQTNHS